MNLDITKSVHAFFMGEENENPPVKNQEQQKSVQVAPVALLDYATPTFVADDKVYLRILALTDFESTDVAQKIHKYLDLLDEPGMDARTKFRMAVKQACSLEHLSPGDILGVFDQLKVNLAHEENSFKVSAAAYDEKEIKSRQRELADIQDKKNALSTREQQLNAELAVQQTKQSNVNAQMSHAIARRGPEIDQQKAKIEAMLKS